MRHSFTPLVFAGTIKNHFEPSDKQRRPSRCNSMWWPFKKGSRPALPVAAGTMLYQIASAEPSGFVV